MSFVLEVLGAQGKEAVELFSRYSRTFAITSLRPYALGSCTGLLMLAP